MRIFAVLLLWVTTLAAQTKSAPAKPIDWAQQQPEILRHFRALLQIDTTNPPGNELAAANYLAALLHKENINSEVLELSHWNLVSPSRGV